MIRPELFASAAVLFVSLASGSLECSAPARSPVAQHGADLYRRMCAVCHGMNGEGYKADQAPAIAHPNFLASVSDPFLREAISNGRGGSTMSAWSTERGGPLSRTDVEAIVGFMHSWEERPRMVLDERPLAGDAQRGAEIYGRECARCHGAHGIGGPNVSIGHPDLLGTSSDGFLRYAIRSGRPGTIMNAFASTLGEQGVEDVVALLRSWQSGAGATVRPPPAKPPPIPLGPVPLNPKGPEPEAFRVYPLTTPADVIKHELERGAKMAILDARAPSDYLNDHISGAVSVPFYDPEPYVADLPKDAWLVCYCACPHAESGNLAQKLQTKGFTKVTVLDEGLGVWKRREYGTHKGIDP
jgi:cytochrome c oxidase cbb3-type subunit 3